MTAKLPASPWQPHGPVQYIPVEKWTDRERAAYIMTDLQQGQSVGGEDDDPWVSELLIRLLWQEIQRTNEHAPHPKHPAFKATTSHDQRRFFQAGVAKGYMRALCISESSSREELIAWLKKQVGDHRL